MDTHDLLEAPQPHWERGAVNDDVAWNPEFWFTWSDQSTDIGDLPLVQHGHATPVVELWTQHNGSVTRAGYLKLCTGTADFGTKSDDIIWWLTRRKGWCLNLDGSIEHVWQKVHSYAELSPRSQPKTAAWQLDSTDVDADTAREDLEAAAKTLRRRYRQELTTAKAAAQEHIVAFSRLSLQWQQRGIGQLMYLTCAQELAARKTKPLYSSTLQSDQAQQLWSRLRDNPNYRVEHPNWSTTPRPVLDFTF